MPDTAASGPERDFLSGLPFPPDPFQIDAIRALGRGRSVLVAAPTGTGKTVVAEFAVHRALAMGLRAVYTTPIKALSNQKFRDFRTRYGEQVGLLTGDLTRNAAGRLLVMTTEVARNMLIQDPGSYRDVACLVFDEVHYLADPERGTAWEESILLAPSHVQMVCLSATVANAAEIAEWIRTTGRDVELIESFQRAVPLNHRYFVDGTLIPVLDGKPLAALSRSQRGGGRAGRTRAAGTGWGERRRGPVRREAEDEAPSPAEVVRALAEADLLPAIYFFFSRRSVEESARACVRMQLIPQAVAAEVSKASRDLLAGLSAEDRSLGQVEQLMSLLPRGIGFHHAGLLPPLKTLVEELLATGKLKVVFATDTLALGINVPARSTVVGEMTKFDGQTRRLLTPGEYRQLTGRAGRRGMDRVGYSILPFSPWVPIDRALEIADGAVSPLQSAFRPSYSTVLNLWRGPQEEERLAQLIAGSLRQFQHGGRIRELSEAREDTARQIAELPSSCEICGDFAYWHDREKRAKKGAERAESAVESAAAEIERLRFLADAWPWEYTKSQRKLWLRSSEPGTVAYSRRHGWAIYLGPSADGIGSFFMGGRVAPIVGYSELSYLPEPPITIQVPESVQRRFFLLDGVAGVLSGEESDTLSKSLRAANLPDLEREAAGAKRAAREAAEPQLRGLEDRLAAAEETRHSAVTELAENPYVRCPHRALHRRTERERRHLDGLLVEAERDLAAARQAASKEAHRTLRSLRSVLEGFGYMKAGEPTRKAEVLRRIFDSNGLLIAELMDYGVLAEVTAVEVAEVASWFAYDKEGAGRPLPITERLARVRSAVESVERHVLDTERRHGLDLSSPLSAQFRGVGLAWATNVSLGHIAEKSGLAEGDVVFALQKSIDICRQIGQAAAYSRVPGLAAKAREAEGLLRHGVVASYYRWIVGDE